MSTAAGLAEKRTELGTVERPPYDITRSFEWNFANGPNYAGPFPEIPETPLKDFYGLKVRSRFGVAASILVNARWVELYSRLGFDILTYKTVRGVPRRCHPLPNWLLADGIAKGAVEDPAQALTLVPADAEAPLAATAAGSFGMPSSAPGFWREDIGRCKAVLREGQVLVVSVVATAEADSTPADIIREFGALSGAVRDAGADGVEVNLSCPNVSGSEGEIFRDAELVGRIVAEARGAIGSCPLLAKVGHMPEHAALARTLQALDGKADAVTMLNGVRRSIVGPDGTPLFGAGREQAGMIGPAIRDVARQAVSDAAEVIHRDGLALGIVGVGGVASPGDALALMDAGAGAVQCASAANWDPLLAARVKSAHPGI